jgi:hypothetical protein
VGGSENFESKVSAKTFSEEKTLLEEFGDTGVGNVAGYQRKV